MTQTDRQQSGPTRVTMPEWFLNGSVLFMLASSFVVFIEPAPVDILFGLVLIFFVQSRLAATFGVVPLLLLLLAYNAGGFVSYIFAPPRDKAMMFMITSSYMAVAGIVFAFYVGSNPSISMKYIGRGWIIGACIASVWALIDYFKLPSPIALQVLPGRATGLFKDPNVFSTYLIFPAILMLQSLILGKTRFPVLTFMALGLMLVALFLAFSRGAWVNFVGAAALMMFLTYIVVRDGVIRTRMVLSIAVILICAAVAFMLLMSIPQIQSMFMERFALIQYYDAGETGRFGNQLNSLAPLTSLPLGFGPFGFRQIYGTEPHNTFINAFASYGWLGGVSYFLLVVSTLIVGARTVLTRTPWQLPAICAFAPMVTTILQGVQIDTEHWRHFYWMLGMVWGLFAATLHQRDWVIKPRREILQAQRGNHLPSAGSPRHGSG
jgi:hypothetical protein